MSDRAEGGAPNPLACDPEAVMARVREALPAVRRLALDAHDNRLPDAVVGRLHSAANAMEDALCCWVSWQRHIEAQRLRAQARGLGAQVGAP